MSALSYTRRAVPWLSLTTAAVPAIALALLAVAQREAAWASTVMYAALLLLAMPAAFVLDEPSAAAVDATPRSPWWCHRYRLLVLVPLLAVAALGVRGWVLLTQLPQPGVPLLIATAFVLAAAASGAVARSVGRCAPGEAVASGVGLVVAGLLLFGPSVRGFAVLPPVGQASASEVWFWVAVTLGAVCVLSAAPMLGARGAVDR